MADQPSYQEIIDRRGKWKEALLSGDYAQTTGALHRIKPFREDNGQEAPVGFCCLGVACDVAIRDGFEEVKEEPNVDDFGENSRAGYRYTVSGGGVNNMGLIATDFLPPTVARYYGLENNDPSLPEGTTLSSLNDGGKTFEQIVDYIDRLPIIKEED